MAHAKNYFQLGLKQALPFIFIVGPFGLVFGTIASKALAFSLWQALHN
jgi:predicted branched-subunit amino acid permease